MDPAQPSPARRYDPAEVLIEEVSQNDLLSIAESYYASFPKEWLDISEPEFLRPASHDIRLGRFAARMHPWLTEPHTCWRKAVLRPGSPDFDPSKPHQVIGFAGWLLPGRTRSEIMNFWRRDAGAALGWRERMGWTEAREHQIWSGLDMVKYQNKGLMHWEYVREQYMWGVGHWYLVGLWVLPEHQNSRAATLLLQDAIQLADREHPLPPMYLECPTPMNRLWYEQFGFRGVEGLGESFVMIRNLWGANIPCEADPGLEEIERKVTRCLPILPRHF